MISGPASERHVVVAALSCEPRAASQVPGACKGQSSKVQSKSHKEESVTVPKKKKKIKQVPFSRKTDSRARLNQQESRWLLL